MIKKLVVLLLDSTTVLLTACSEEEIAQMKCEEQVRSAF